jgi:hypothetical protein
VTPTAERTTVIHEGKYHHYTGRRIPWYVHALWISFWCFVAYYAVQYFVPMIQLELRSPP